MQSLLKNNKALSPVVAAIILIAVTVAVSIAVAAWMGSLTIGFMDGTSQLTITDVTFVIGDETNGRIIAHVANTGTSTFTVDRVRVNGEYPETWSSATSNTITPSTNETFTVTQAVVAGNKYAITFYRADGTMVGAYTSTA